MALRRPGVGFTPRAVGSIVLAVSWEVPMFDSLTERMKQDEKLEVNPTERAIRLAAVLVISLVVFGGLYFVVRLLE